MKRGLRWGLVEQIGFVLLCAVLFEFAGNFLLYQWQNRELISAEQSQRTAERLGEAIAAANAAAPRDRVALMQSMGDGKATFNWVGRTVLTDSSHAYTVLADLRERLITHAPELARRELRLMLLPSVESGARDLVGAVALDDGSFLSFRVFRYIGAPLAPAAMVGLHLLFVAMVAGAALLMVRRLTRPLSELAKAADETERDHAAAISLKGPHEVRRVATAFAAMQGRLLRTNEENTQALISVSHDLRTPIQRLRLRSAMLKDEELQEAFAQDLSEMEHFIDSTIAYVRSGFDEAPRLLDVSALLRTVADDACDLGADARFSGPDSLLLNVRPTILRRVIDNLVDNARKYGRRIDIDLSGEELQRAAITVEDDGPGIAPEERKNALRPFRRLARAVDAGLPGAGLGLAYVARAIEKQGGSIWLGTGSKGGLSVRIELLSLEPSALTGSEGERYKAR